MAAFATWQQHRLRWILVAIAILVVALLAALAVHLYALLQPERFTGLLERELAGAGIRLELQAPAEPRLFPRPGVHLTAFSLTNAGSRTPVLQAAGATIVVPWRALLHGEPAIERVEVETPRIDLGQLRALLARLPRHRGPPRLPTIATGVHMSQGTLTNGGAPLLFELSLDTGELVPGRPFRMDLSARSVAGRSVAATLTAVPIDTQGNVIDFDPIGFRFVKQGGILLQLQGQGSWRGGEDLALRLHGTLRHPSLAPPVASGRRPGASGRPAAATAPTTADSSTDRIALEFRPARGNTPLGVAITIDGVDAHADFQLQPTAVAGWWQHLLAATAGQPPGPLPFTGRAAVRKLDLGWLKATDVRIDAGPDLAPASAASTAPAPATSTAH